MIDQAKLLNAVRNGPRPQAWLVSFGDLLTLLLCFFIAIVASSPINPAVRSQSYTEKETYRSELKQRLNKSGPASRHGTAIAKFYMQQGGLLISRLALGMRDFAQNPHSLSRRALRAVKKQIAPRGYTLRQVLVETCAGTEMFAGSANMPAALERGLALRSQVIDAGATRSQVGVRVVGANCRVPAGRRALAVISFELERVRHG